MSHPPREDSSHIFAGRVSSHLSARSAEHFRLEVAKARPILIEIKCRSHKVLHAARVAGDAVIIFDREITFEPDGTAVIWATPVDGTRIKVSVTKPYAETTWRIRFSEEEVRRLIWVYIDDLRAAAARAHTAGRKELIL